jgi:hypothetical protein
MSPFPRSQKTGRPTTFRLAASKLAEQARQYAGKAQQAVQELKPFVERSLKDQLMATLAGATVVGFFARCALRRANLLT